MDPMDQAKKVFSNGLRCLDCNDFEGAEKCFLETLSHAPKSTPTLNNLSIAQYKQGKLSSAIQTAINVLEIDAKNVDALFMLATCYKDCGEYDKSLTLFDKITTLDPMSADAYYNQSLILSQKNNYQDAIISADCAVRIQPTFPDAYLSRGNALGKLKRYDEALIAYDKALALKPDFARAWLGRGQALVAMKRYDDSVRFYEQIFQNHYAQLTSTSTDYRKNCKKAVFVGCARNCADFIQAVLLNISRVSMMFAEAAFVFVQNDSTDGTAEIIKVWCAKNTNSEVITLDGLADVIKERTIRLEIARNALLARIKDEFADYDYLFVVDLDDVNSMPWDLGEFVRALEFLEEDKKCAGAFASQQNGYYDTYAFRHNTICPNDLFEEFADAIIFKRYDYEKAFLEVYWPLFEKINDALMHSRNPVEVRSAFGGIGIYKIRSVLHNSNKYIGQKIKTLPQLSFLSEYFPGKLQLGWQTCEHVSFHEGFINNDEKLFVLPYLRNNSFGRDFLHQSWHLKFANGAFIKQNFFERDRSVDKENRVCVILDSANLGRAHESGLMQK